MRVNQPDILDVCSVNAMGNPISRFINKLYIEMELMCQYNFSAWRLAIDKWKLEVWVSTCQASW